MRTTVLPLALLLVCAASAPPSGSTPPIRPPAVPLLVRNPYLSIWQSSNRLAGTWASFWNGDPKPLTGIARIDGKDYVFMGAPAHVGASLQQTGLSITATQSKYTFDGAGVTLTVDFLSPVEAGDLRRLSMPFAYISAVARSNDGAPHEVSLYIDVSGHLAAGDPTMPIGWRMQSISNGATPLRAFTISPAKPHLLQEYSDEPQWGTVVFATQDRAGLRYEAGPDSFVHADATSTRGLQNSVDSDQPRVAVSDPAVFAFEVPLGRVTSQATDPAVFLIGLVRNPAVSYLHRPLPPLWKSFWPQWQNMAAFAYADFASALGRATDVDRRIATAAESAGGSRYAALCALAMRQSFGSTELVGTAKAPWMFMKEISSDGNVSTVDVVYPSFPVFLYENPRLLGLLLDPLFAYAEYGGWPKRFAEHDIGSAYPNADGHNNGEEEDMPVEESANMLIMADAYMRKIPAADARGYAVRHYRILKQWADYERAHSVNPAFQNQTDDFTGFIKSSANLALKGILSVGAMGQIAHMAGNAADARTYTGAARQMIEQWQRLAQSKNGRHLVLAYGEEKTWSLKYNAFPDKVLHLGLLPESVLDEESAYYATRERRYGVPLDNRHTYTKADWELWVAAATDDENLRHALIDRVYDYANETASRNPFPDWYDTVTAENEGFMARPVMGATFSLLLREEAP